MRRFNEHRTALCQVFLISPTRRKTLMFDSPGFALFVVVAVLFLGSYAIGTQYNVRLGDKALKWLQKGLPQVGEKATLRWLGSSAVELVITKARSPFRQATLLIVLEPRDIPWLWLLTWFQGRRDVLIIRAQLQTVPQYEFDLIAPHAWSETKQSGKLETQRWADEPLDELNFRAPSTTRSLSRAMAPAALQAARQIHPNVWRLSARRDEPPIIEVGLIELEQPKD